MAKQTTTIINLWYTRRDHDGTYAVYHSTKFNEPKYKGLTKSDAISKRIALNKQDGNKYE